MEQSIHSHSLLPYPAIKPKRYTPKLSQWHMQPMAQRHVRFLPHVESMSRCPALIIARASTISSVTSSVSVNGTNAVTVNITRASSSFTHTVVFSIGSYSKTTSSVATSTSYAIPQSWLNAIPNATSGTAKVTVTTYSGSTKIGSAVSKNFTITVPDSVVPSFSSVAVSDTTTNQSTFGNMVQSKSKAKFTITAAGSYGSTIKTYKTEFEGKSYSGATPTTSTITKSGTASAKITITDSRGRTATTTKTWTVVPYSAPKIINFQGFRCLQNGTENYEGTFISATVNFSIASVNEKNAKSYAIDYKLTTATAWTALTSGSVYALNSNIISASGAFSVDRSYDIRLTIKDSFATITSTFEIPTAFTLLDFNASGKGIKCHICKRSQYFLSQSFGFQQGIFKLKRLPDGNFVGYRTNRYLYVSYV